MALNSREEETGEDRDDNSDICRDCLLVRPFVYSFACVKGGDRLHCGCDHGEWHVGEKISEFALWN
jgi:hypothetical protein